MASRTISRGLLSTVAVIAAAAAAPAPGHAAVITFGSDLTAPADTVQRRQADTAYWQTAFADGRSPLAPAAGQITSFRLKGITLSSPIAGLPGGETMFHLQALRARADGSFQILRSSAAFYVPPRTADPQTITTYAPENFCVDAGDVLVFNTVGGWDGIVNQTGPYPLGTPLQVFSSAPGASVSEFMGADKTNDGDIITARASHRQELLMQLKVATGRDATPLCPGGAAGVPAPAPPPPPRVQKSTLPASQRVTVSRKGKLSVSLFCLPGSTACSGTVRVQTRGAAPLLLGSGTFAIAPKSNGRSTIVLNGRGRSRFFKAGRGRLAVNIVAETRPGGPSRMSWLVVTLRRRGR